MSRKAPEFTTTITIRLTDQDKEDLTRLCEALNVTKSEFLRKKVSNINNTIMSNNLFNIPPAPEPDAWWRKIAGEKGKQEAEKSFKEQMNEEFNTQLMEQLTNVSANEWKKPFSTPEGILDQLKKRE